MMRSDAASAAGGDDQGSQGGLLGGFCGCLSVRYYQPYFDVDTAHVVERIKFALFPFKREEGFIQLLGPNPDAYGPFWIATTLVFAIAVVSNLSSYFGFTPAEDGAKW
jgi:protein YIPF1/2